MQEVSNQQEQNIDNKIRANNIPVYTQRYNEETYRQNEQNTEHTPRKKENNKNDKESEVELIVAQNDNTPHAERHRSVHHKHHHHRESQLDDHSNINNDNEHHENSKSRMHIVNTEMEAVRAQSVWPQHAQRFEHKHYIPLPPNYQAWNNGLQSLPPITHEQAIATTATHHKKERHVHKNDEMENDKVIAGPKNAKQCKEHGRERSVSVLSRRESNRAASHSLRAMLRVNDSPRYYHPISSTISHNAHSKSIEQAKRPDKQKLTQNKENVNNENLNKAKLEPECKGNVKFNPLRKLSSTVSSIFSGNINNIKIEVAENNKIEETKKETKARSKSHHDPLYLEENYKKRNSSSNNNNISMYRIPLDQLSSIRQTEVFADNTGDCDNETTLTASNDKGSKSDKKENDNHNKTHDQNKLLNGNTNPKHKIKDHTQYHLEETHQKLQYYKEKEEELQLEKERQNGYYTVNLEDEIHLSYDDTDDNNNNNQNENQNNAVNNNNKDKEIKHTTEKVRDKDKETKSLDNITQSTITVSNHSDNDNDNDKKDDKIEETCEAEQSASKPINENANTKGKENENEKVKITRFWTTLQFQHNIARAMIKHNNERVYGLLKKYNKLVAQNEVDARKLFSGTNPLCTNTQHTSTEHLKKQEEQQQENEITDKNRIKPHREVLIENIDYDNNDDDNNDDDNNDDENNYEYIDEQTLTASGENTENKNDIKKEPDELTTKIWVNQPIKIVKRSILDRVLDPETGYTLMHLAVLTKDIDCVRICLNYGTEAHRIEDLQGDTPLTLAMKRFPSCVMTLFYNGQNVRVHKPLGLQEITQHHEQRHSFEHSQKSVKAESTNESRSKMPSLMKKLSSLRNILYRIGGSTSDTVNRNRFSTRNSTIHTNGEGEVNNNTKSKHEQQIMQQYSQTLVHRAVIADALTPPWPERLQFIKLLVSQYHVNAGSTDYYGFTPSMWAMQHEPYLLPHELYKPLMRYLNHAARVAAYESEVNKMNGLGYDAILRLAGIPPSSIDRVVSESVTRLPEEWESPLHVHHEENVEMNANEKSNVVKQKQQDKKEEKELFERQKDEMANATIDAAKDKKLAKIHEQDNNIKNDHIIEETRRLEESPAPTRPETNITHDNLTVNRHEVSHALSGASSQRWRLSTIPHQNLFPQIPLNNALIGKKHSELETYKNEVDDNDKVYTKNLPSHHNKRELSTASYDKLKTKNTNYCKKQSEASHYLKGGANEMRESHRHESRSSIIAVMQRPLARLLMLITIFIIHNIENALDVSASTLHVFRNEFWFRIFNMVFSGWGGSPFFMGLVHLVCLLVGMVVIGYYIMYVGLCKRLLCYVCQIPAFGAQSRCELVFWQRSCGAAYKDKHYGKANRSRIFALPFSVLNGILISSAIYNALMRSYWPGQVRWMAIRPVMGDNINNFYQNNRINLIPPYTTNCLSYIDQSRIVWSVTLAIDWLIVCTVVHMMYEQGILYLYLPSHACASLANWIDSKRYAVYRFTHRNDANMKIEHLHKKMEQTCIADHDKEPNNTQEHQSELQEEKYETPKMKANKFARQKEQNQQRRNSSYYNNQQWCTHSARSTQKFILASFWIMLIAGWVLIAIPFTVVGALDSLHRSHKYQFHLDTYHIIDSDNKNSNNYVLEDNLQNNLLDKMPSNTIESEIELKEVQMPLMSDTIQEKEHKRVLSVNYIRCCAAILFASINMSLLCLACLQDWNWPTLQSHVLLTLPGTVFTGHNSWLLMLMLYVSWTCSMRNLIENWRVITMTKFIDVSDFISTQLDNTIQKEHANFIPAIAVATVFTLPAVLSLCLVCVAVISTSLHFIRHSCKNNSNVERLYIDNTWHTKSTNRHDNYDDDNDNNLQTSAKSITEWRYGWHLLHKPASPVISLIFYYFARELTQLKETPANLDSSCDNTIITDKANANTLTSKQGIAMLQLLEFLRETKLLELPHKHLESEKTIKSINNKSNNNEETDKQCSLLEATSSPTSTSNKFEELEEEEFEEEEELLLATSPLEALTLLTAFEVILPNKHNVVMRNKITEQTNQEKLLLTAQQGNTPKKEETEIHKLLLSKIAESKVSAIRWILKTRLHYKTYKQQIYRNEMLARGVQSSIQHIEIITDTYHNNNNYDNLYKNNFKSKINPQRGYHDANNAVVVNQNTLSTTAKNNNINNNVSNNNEERQHAIIARPFLQNTNNNHQKQKQPLWHRASDASSQRMLNRKRQYSIRKREQEYLHALDK